MRLLYLSAVFLTGLFTAPAEARDYHPASLTACQAAVQSTADNAACLEREIDKLSVRLPAGSEPFRSSVQRQFNARYENDGTAGIALALNCMMQAFATKVGGHERGHR